MKQLTIQIKPAGNNCNIACSYCYASPFKNKKLNILKLELLEKIIKEALEISNNVIITWHGGEPTLVGVDYFREYIKILNKYKKQNQVVINMVQTNATLITEEMAKFFKDNNFVVSVSLDGNEECHNINRYDFKKVGSFSRTMRGIDNLRNVGINPPIISTVSKNTYKYMSDNFDFFIKNGFKEIKYSPVYDSVTDDFSISDEEWYEALKNIFYKWLRLKDSTIKVREIDEVLMWFAKSPLYLCTSGQSCINWISIDDRGNMYPCEYLRSTNSYGNISQMQLIDVFKTKEYNDFKEKINTLPKRCQDCKLVNFCHNGCPATRIKNDRIDFNGLYVYCNARRELFNEIKKVIGM